MRFKKAASAALLAFFIVTVHAQAPAYDAGALMRQAEQSFQQSQMQRNQQKRHVLAPEMVLSDATFITVERFKFLGIKLMSEEQLQRIAEPYANKTLNQQQLNQLTQAISDSYRQSSWLVQAYIPRQDISTKELIIQVIESIPPNRPVK